MKLKDLYYKGLASLTVALMSVSNSLAGSSGSSGWVGGSNPGVGNPGEPIKIIGKVITMVIALLSLILQATIVFGSPILAFYGTRRKMLQRGEDTGWQPALWAGITFFVALVVEYFINNWLKNYNLDFASVFSRFSGQ